MTARPSSPPPKPPGKKSPAPPPPSHKYEEKESIEDTEVVKDQSILEQSDQEHSVKITIDDTPVDSDEDDVDDKPIGQVDKSVDPVEAGYQRSMKRLLSNITEISDDECDDCDEAEIVMNFPEEKKGATSRTDVTQDRYKVDIGEKQDEENETEAENFSSFIDSAFTLNETELNDETIQTENKTPKLFILLSSSSKLNTENCDAIISKCKPVIHPINIDALAEKHIR